MGAICRLKRVRAWSRGRAFLRGVAGSATMLAQGAAGEPQAGTPGPGAGGGEVPRLPGPDGRRVPHQPPVCAVMRLRTARRSVPPGLCPAASCPVARAADACVRMRRRLVARKIVRGMRRRTAHVAACIRARAWMLEPLPSRARPCACTEIGEHLPNLTDNTSISERRIMTQTMAHLLLLVVSSYSAGLVRYRRFSRSCHCFDTMLHV
jgi:hypothetical protein